MFRLRSSVLAVYSHCFACQAYIVMCDVWPVWCKRSVWCRIWNMAMYMDGWIEEHIYGRVLPVCLQGKEVLEGSVSGCGTYLQANLELSRFRGKELSTLGT
ncbi:hypothetical protein F5Y14DRAFT_302389 [Nemania sp. NC0429]|nr:hypothetical protein F5Y14DRAFT_302389 [Nemania sp. NC0429]